MEADFGNCDEAMMVAEEGYCTPKRGIPVRTAPPPAPRKKVFRGCAGKRKSPEKGYFRPPDLDQLFAVRSRRETCV